jgi:hypothetical protein
MAHWVTITTVWSMTNCSCTISDTAIKQENMMFKKHISSTNVTDNRISNYFWRNVKLENLGFNFNYFIIFFPYIIISKQYTYLYINNYWLWKMRTAVTYLLTINYTHLNLEYLLTLSNDPLLLLASTLVM